MKSVTQRKAMITRVVAAFRASGGLKAGTPFETASTPVVAVQPVAKARRIRKVLRAITPLGVGVPAGTTGAIPPVTARKAPAAINPGIVARKKYVGTANIRPDSRRPRRLPMAMIAMKPRL